MPLFIHLFPFFPFFSAGNQLGAQVQVQVRLLVDFAYCGLHFFYVCVSYFSIFSRFFGKAKRHLQRAVKLRRWQVTLHEEEIWMEGCRGRFCDCYQLNGVKVREKPGMKPPPSLHSS